MYDQNLSETRFLLLANVSYNLFLALKQPKSDKI